MLLNGELLLWLIGFHFIGDIALQSDWVAAMKGKRVYIMIAHVAIWTTIICLPLKFFGVLDLWKVLFLFTVHFASDTWKVSQPKDDAHWYLIYYDQAIHFAQLVVVTIF